MKKQEKNTAKGIRNTYTIDKNGKIISDTTLTKLNNRFSKTVRYM